jgi:hypothetical protein
MPRALCLVMFPFFIRTPDDTQIRTFVECGQGKTNYDSVPLYLPSVWTALGANRSPGGEKPTAARHTQSF